MKLNHGLHLGYCTNIHRGETWQETFESLQKYTLAVKKRVSPNKPYGIGLRLSNRAAHELNDAATLRNFQRWLDQNGCYVFTINGFPFGRFHGANVKEHVYTPDWTSPERLAYTNLLFDILSQLLPGDVDGSVSTLPCSFKDFHLHGDDLKTIRSNIWQCVEHVARVAHRSGRNLHLGLEPEPLCLLECSGETIQFFDRMRADHSHDERLDRCLGLNYDTCHFAVEFEEPRNAIACFQQHRIKLSKIHLSSALKLKPTPDALRALNTFADESYLHQVVTRKADGTRVIYKDLDVALAAAKEIRDVESQEWRIHFHIPLHSEPGAFFANTSDHLLGMLDLLAENPALCSHLEMETYTWDVLPPELKGRDVVEQLVSEYDWTLKRLAERGFATV